MRRVDEFENVSSLQSKSPPSRKRRENPGLGAEAPKSKARVPIELLVTAERDDDTSDSRQTEYIMWDHGASILGNEEIPSTVFGAGGTARCSESRGSSGFVPDTQIIVPLLPVAEILWMKKRGHRIESESPTEPNSSTRDLSSEE
jgi:hypothetical protein